MYSQNIPVFENKINTDFGSKSIIGSGTFGSVYKTQSTHDNGKYAIKKIIIQDPSIENREIDILSKLDANYVVKYYDSWLETSMGTGGPAVLYIQMELCSFNLRYVTTLKKTCFKTQPNKGVGHVEYFISYHLFKEILEAVDYLHTRVPQIIHRDLKPANILVFLNLAQKRCIKLGDFGLAKVHASASQSHTKGAGAQRYIAPEVASGRSYNTKADVYSIGIFVEELFNIDINKSTEYPGLIDLMNEMLTYY
ncbi:unnamed protein product [Oppiella nova]|uniref:non-specific serine/threonine protein kinase n=1 Tax=Oppiella nova TaxID=334625 RepID=A0A7R9QR33_9ACAR|nr:unnamed protein product [Oppiella nova]CAG2172519.1 unnamed protein product [Oppiella nova]